MTAIQILTLAVGLIVAMFFAAWVAVGLQDFIDSINKDTWKKSLRSFATSIILGCLVWHAFVELGAFSKSINWIFPSLLLGLLSLGMSQSCFKILKALNAKIAKKAGSVIDNAKTPV
ncbi:hypothetical protein Dip510_000818 [Elusimicrobium posterum]|uniref:hypothetical protein n=1 Tax=Elusimicrobium posterum TaxID=3116653 RepID=UPI003C76B524